MEQPLGDPVDWTAAKRPGRIELQGSRVLLRPIDPLRDADALFEQSHAPNGDPAIWTYLFEGPFASSEEFREFLGDAQASEDLLFFTLCEVPDQRPAGVASYLRITPDQGVIEIGNIWFAPRLQRTTGATEAIYLLARHAFDELGYRRLEWKCNSLNAASRRAAERFGFSFEGIFRKHFVVKGRNRDTAWYAITDDAWPTVRAAFEMWLAPENFDRHGSQKRSLADVRRSLA